MAEKHLLSFSMIHEFFKSHSAQLKKGENAYNSGHVMKMVYDSSVEPPLIRGEVSASMKKKKYSVQMNTNRNGVIESMTCDCPRGEDLCHHMAAFAFHCHYNISVTDNMCTWSKKQNKEETFEPIKDIYKAKPYVATCRQAKSEEIEKFKEVLQKYRVGFTWLLRDETTTDFIGLMLAIEDIIFSEEYLSSDDKALWFQERCRISRENIQVIERQTIAQSSNENWLVARKYRLTASKFGRVLNAVNRNKFPPSLLKGLLELSVLDQVLAVQWGREHEQTAVKAFSDVWE